MKKYLLLILACVFMPCACQKSMNQIINDEPSITGTVVEVYENSDGYTDLQNEMK